MLLLHTNGIIPAEDPTNSCSPVTSSWHQAHAQTSVYQNVAKLRHSHVTSVYQNVIGISIQKLIELKSLAAHPKISSQRCIAQRFMHRSHEWHRQQRNASGKQIR